MTDQLSSLYVASLVVALIGLVVLVNALLASGLRWMGRRVSGFWRGKEEHSESSTGTDDARRSLFDPPSAVVPPNGSSADPPRRFVPR